MAMARAVGVVENGDQPMPPSELERYLDDLERLDAWFGGYALTEKAVAELTRAAPPERPLLIVDVGGARGGLAVRLVEAARQRGRSARVVVLDRDETSLVLGRRAAKTSPEVLWLQADAAALPFRENSIDVATMSLTLHHLEPPAAVRALAGMRSAARFGVVVNDLLRTRFAWAMVWIATRLFTRHPFARHDGPLSVRRAYAASEVKKLAALAGFTGLVVQQFPWMARLVAVGS